MIKIGLQPHSVYPWRTASGASTIQIRGLFRYRGRYYESGIPEELLNIRSEEDFKAALAHLSGNFALVCRFNGKTIAAVDRISIYPLFFSQSGADITISDRFTWMEQQQPDLQGDPESLLEFLATQMVLSNRTLAKGVYVLNAGQYLVADDTSGALTIHDYDTHRHTEAYPNDFTYLKQKHEEVIDDVFRRMIDSLHGRKVILFLSGGYDSRLVAVQLHKFHYTNVLCVSFSTAYTPEVQVAKEVAAQLGFEWKLLEVDNHYVRSLAQENSSFAAYQSAASNGFRVPYLEFVLLKPYFDRGELPKDCVIVNGNSGDFIEGDQFSPRFVPGESYTSDALVDAILERHFLLSGKKICSYPGFRTTISSILQLDANRSYSYAECQELYEQFNWRERQCKYVVNSINEAEEFLHTDWRLPLWDDALVDFWLNVPIEQRAFRSLYLRIVGEESFPTANTKTLYLHSVQRLKALFPQLIWMLYPLKKAISFLKPDSLFYTVSFKQFLEVLSYTKGYQTDTISVYAYLLSQTLYQKYYGNTRRFIKHMLSCEAVI